jgi:hypothetical protein
MPELSEIIGQLDKELDRQHSCFPSLQKGDKEGTCNSSLNEREVREDFEGQWYHDHRRRSSPPRVSEQLRCCSVSLDKRRSRCRAQLIDLFTFCPLAAGAINSDESLFTIRDYFRESL